MKIQKPPLRATKPGTAVFFFWVQVASPLVTRGGFV